MCQAWSRQGETLSPLRANRSARVVELEEVPRAHYTLTREVRLICHYPYEIVAPAMPSSVAQRHHMTGHTLKDSGKRIRQIRNRLRLTQAQFAEHLGVAVNTLAKWEREDPVPPPRLAVLAAEGLECLLTSHKQTTTKRRRPK